VKLDGGIELPGGSELDASVQLRRDIDHLRMLKRGLERTINLIHRANRAYMDRESSWTGPGIRPRSDLGPLGEQLISSTDIRSLPARSKPMPCASRGDLRSRCATVHRHPGKQDGERKCAIVRGGGPDAALSGRPPVPFGGHIGDFLCAA
jgi:hypothetical protein